MDCISKWRGGLITTAAAMMLAAAGCAVGDEHRVDWFSLRAADGSKTAPPPRVPTAADAARLSKQERATIYSRLTRRAAESDEAGRHESAITLWQRAKLVKPAGDATDLENLILIAQTKLEIQQYLTDGDAALERGNFSMASRFYRRARSIAEQVGWPQYVAHAEARLDTTSHQSNLTQARAYLKQDKLKAAEAALANARQARPDGSPEIDAVARAIQARHRAAREKVQRALSADPTKLSDQRKADALAVILHEVDRLTREWEFDAALKALQRARAFQPRNDQTDFNRRRLIIQTKSQIHAHMDRGRRALHDDDTRQAIAHFRKARTVAREVGWTDDERRADWQIDRAAIISNLEAAIDEAKSGRFRRAEQILNMARQLYPEHAQRIDRLAAEVTAIRENHRVDPETIEPPPTDQ